MVTAEVKKGLAVEGAILLVKRKANQLIRQKAAEALKKSRLLKLYRVKSPVTLWLELVETGTVPVKPSFMVVVGRTYEATAATMEEAYRFLR